MSAPRVQRVRISSSRDLLAVAQDVDDAAQAVGQAGVQAGVAEDEAQHLRQPVADGLEVALEGEVVGEVELADARRVAAAAEVLQQQHVVELAQGRHVEADLRADVHADPAARAGSGPWAGPR